MQRVRVRSERIGALPPSVQHSVQRNTTASNHQQKGEDRVAAQQKADCARGSADFG